MDIDMDMEDEPEQNINPVAPRYVRMAAINLRDRDGLQGRLFDVRCPVQWLHGTSDAVYSVENAKEEIKLFKNSKDAKLETVQDEQHPVVFASKGGRRILGRLCGKVQKSVDLECSTIYQLVLTGIKPMLQPRLRSSCPHCRSRPLRHEILSQWLPEAQVLALDLSSRQALRWSFIHTSQSYCIYRLTQKHESLSLLFATIPLFVSITNIESSLNGDRSIFRTIQYHKSTF